MRLPSSAVFLPCTNVLRTVEFGRDILRLSGPSICRMKTPSWKSIKN